MAPETTASRRIVIGLDLGTRRTGVAVSDALGMLAHPRRAILHGNETELEAAVARLVAEEEAAAIVVGLPVTLGGGSSQQTRETRVLARRLRQATGLPVIEWDERLTTRQAERSGRRPRHRATGELDSAAAATLLQAYLDAQAAEAAT